MSGFVASLGLGNRVKVICHALSNGFGILWTINSHCPNSFFEVFPNGIPGLDVREISSSKKVSYQFTCDPPDAESLVRLIFSCMAVQYGGNHSLGIHFRGFRARSGMYDFVETIPNIVSGHKEVVCLADSYRVLIESAIGDKVLPSFSRPMSHDFDRSKEDLIPFLNDWARLLSCEKIVSNFPQSGIIWPHKYLRQTHPK